MRPVVCLLSNIYDTDQITSITPIKYPTDPGYHHDTKPFIGHNDSVTPIGLYLIQPSFSKVFILYLLLMLILLG